MKMGRFSFQAVSGFLFLFFLTGCRDSDVLYRISEIKKLKQEALMQSVKTPYRQKQHEALVAYYSALVSEAVSILDEGWRESLLNAWVDEGELAEMCGDIFLERRAHEDILRNCRRNNFFLCADELLAFDDALQKVLLKLTSESRRKFDSTSICRRVVQ